MSSCLPVRLVVLFDRQIDVWYWTLFKVANYTANACCICNLYLNRNAQAKTKLKSKIFYFTRKLSQLKLISKKVLPDFERTEYLQNTQDGTTKYHKSSNMYTIIVRGMGGFLIDLISGCWKGLGNYKC